MFPFFLSLFNLFVSIFVIFFFLESSCVSKSHFVLTLTFFSLWGGGGNCSATAQKRVKLSDVMRGCWY